MQIAGLEVRDAAALDLALEPRKAGGSASTARMASRARMVNPTIRGVLLRDLEWRTAEGLT